MPSDLPIDLLSTPADFSILYNKYSVTTSDYSPRGTLALYSSAATAFARCAIGSTPACTVSGGSGTAPCVASRAEPNVGVTGRCVPQACNDGYHLEGGACLRGASGGPVSSGGAFVLWLFGIVVGAAAAAGFIYFKQKGGWRLGGQNFAMQLHDVPSGPSGFGSGFGLASAAATSSASAAQSHAAPGASLLDNLRSRAQSSDDTL